MRELRQYAEVFAGVITVSNLPAPQQQKLPVDPVNAWLMSHDEHTNQAYVYAYKRALEAIDALSKMYPDISWAPVKLSRQQVRLILSWLEHKFGQDSATVAQTCAAMSSLWSYIIREFPGKIENNPWRGLRIRVRDTINERILSEQDVRRMVAAAGSARDKVFLRFLYNTQLRISEAVNARPRDIRRTESGRYLCSVWGKGKKQRTVEISPSVMQAIMAMQKRPDWDKPIFGFTSRQGWNIVHGAAEKAGLQKDVRPHFLRHSGATHALDHGCPLHVLQAGLGHARISTTEIYTHVSPENRPARYLLDV